MKLRPLYDRIVVRILDEGEISKGGLYVVDRSTDKQTTGEVVAVGNGRLLEDGTIKPLETKAGDTILFSKSSSNKITLENQDFYVMREADIVGIVV